MSLAEIQAKYAGVHTPEEIEQFHQNMDNSKKWNIVKNEWTWNGLNQMQLRGRAIMYHPTLDLLELYNEHPYKTALRLVHKAEALDNSGDEESVADSDLEEDDDDEAAYELQVKEAARQYNELKKRMAPPSETPTTAKKTKKAAAALDADGNPVAKNPVSLTSPHSPSITPRSSSVSSRKAGTSSSLRRSKVLLPPRLPPRLLRSRMR